MRMQKTTWHLTFWPKQHFVEETVYCIQLGLMTYDKHSRNSINCAPNFSSSWCWRWQDLPLSSAGCLAGPACPGSGTRLSHQSQTRHSEEGFRGLSRRAKRRPHCDLILKPSKEIWYLSAKCCTEDYYYYWQRSHIPKNLQASAGNLN